jgi:enamine deaminase RidA (YjgF/YER057c/UK114 family)
MVGRGDIVAQAEQVFDNLKRVLASAGAGFEHVVKMTVFVVGRHHVDDFRRYRSGLFERLYPSGNYPTTTFLVVDGLASPEFLVEVEAVAAPES